MTGAVAVAPNGARVARCPRIASAPEARAAGSSEEETVACEGDAPGLSGAARGSGSRLEPPERALERTRVCPRLGSRRAASPPSDPTLLHLARLK